MSMSIYFTPLEKDAIEMNKNIFFKPSKDDQLLKYDPLKIEKQCNIFEFMEWQRCLVLCSWIPEG